MLCLLRIVEGFGTSFEPDQPAHPCCLTRFYIVGCSDSYFVLISLTFTMDCSKIKVHCLILTW